MACFWSTHRSQESSEGPWGAISKEMGKTEGGLEEERITNSKDLWKCCIGMYYCIHIGKEFTRCCPVAVGQWISLKPQFINKKGIHY